MSTHRFVGVPYTDEHDRERAGRLCAGDPDGDYGGVWNAIPARSSGNFDGTPR
jgi:hypothetical protein